MPRTYTVPFEIGSIQNAQDLIRITAGTNKSLELLEARITQRGINTQEQFGAQIHIASTAGTGTGVAARPNVESDIAFSGTCINNLTVDTTVDETKWLENQSALNGFLWVPTPDIYIEIAGTEIIVLRLDSNFSTTTALTATMVIKEYG